MNVEQVGITPEAAKQKLTELEDAAKSAKLKKVQSQYDKQMVMLESAYKSLAKGKKLLDLDAVVSAAAVDDKHRPLLGIGRSDLPQVKLRWRGTTGMLEYITTSGFTLWGNVHPSRYIEVRMDRVNDFYPYTLDGRTYHKEIEGFSLIPTPPPAVKIGRKLSGYFTLWEVKKWADNRLDKPIDRDPLLLKRIGGNIFSVEDSWDLTDVEALIMKALIQEEQNGN